MIIRIICLYFFMVLLAHEIRAQTFKMVSYNVRYDNPHDSVNNWMDRRWGMVELLQENTPAIIGIQEGLYRQVRFLDSCLVNYKYIGIGRDDGLQGGEYCAIFFDTTRLKVKDISTFWLSETPEKVSRGWDAALERICTYGLFEDIGTNRKFWVFNTHFDHRGPEARIRSAALILNKINELNSEHLPLILMGDFNARPDEEPVRLLMTQLNDGLKLSEIPLTGPSGTFNGFTNEEITDRIDYFFLTDLKVLSYAHIIARMPNNKHVSDHLPVIINLEINEN